MSTSVFDKEFDNVIKSIFITGKTTYQFAVENLHPQIDEYYAQRKKVDEKFYQKLERDLVAGCIMPAITIALISNDVESLANKSASEFIEVFQENTKSLYILDGIQRLNILKKAYKEQLKNHSIYFNFLICSSDDKLLYRMITLNNGQKPMSARHQIEVLAHNIFDFDNLGIPIQSEKQRARKKIKGSFDKDDIIKGYISFLSESTNIDNQKIIESKMDELIADKIIESEITQGTVQFVDVISKIELFIEDEYLFRWFKQSNNLIGFCAGIGKTFSEVEKETKDTFRFQIERFEKAFESFDVSKIKLGQLRRLSVSHFISKFDLLKSFSQSELEDVIAQASILYR